MTHAYQTGTPEHRRRKADHDALLGDMILMAPWPDAAEPSGEDQ